MVFFSWRDGTSYLRSVTSSEYVSSNIVGGFLFGLSVKLFVEFVLVFFFFLNNLLMFGNLLSGGEFVILWNCFGASYVGLNIVFASFIFWFVCMFVYVFMLYNNVCFCVLDKMIFVGFIFLCIILNVCIDVTVRASVDARNWNVVASSFKFLNVFFVSVSLLLCVRMFFKVICLMFFYMSYCLMLVVFMKGVTSS